MAVSKNAILRYQVIDRCLRNPGKKYSIYDLVEECNHALYELDGNVNGIKKRQIYNDIRFMKSEQGWFAPIESKVINKKAYYYYTEKNFSINNQALNQMEASQLKSALQILSRFKGTPQFTWVNELIPKLEKCFGLKTADEDIIAFDDNMDLMGLENIGILFNSIYYKKVLKVVYIPFYQKEMILNELHPYYLKQYNRRWFLFAFLPNEDFIINLAIDRIKSISEVDKTYIENNKINFIDYFDDIVGVTRNNSASEKITIRFSKDSAPYVLTKPLHGTQKIINQDSDNLWISIEVIPNWELESQILAFGENAEVIAPVNFKNAIKQRISKTMNIYKKNASSDCEEAST